MVQGRLMILHHERSIGSGLKNWRLSSVEVWAFSEVDQTRAGVIELVECMNAIWECNRLSEAEKSGGNLGQAKTKSPRHRAPREPQQLPQRLLFLSARNRITAVRALVIDKGIMPQLRWNKLNNTIQQNLGPVTP